MFSSRVITIERHILPRHPEVSGAPAHLLNATAEDETTRRLRSCRYVSAEDAGEAEAQGSGRPVAG